MTNKSQMLKGILEGCVLKILNDEPCYSGELVVKLKEKGFDTVSEGTLFPMLLRLENKGLFDVERVSNPLGPSRKYYRLNDTGKAELTKFIKEWEEFRSLIDSVLEGKQ
ncbi:MAG: PadR family transcriptional regulator [Clostridia bacterium]|nr:PadR family transcriptional regulator [Clostridia bacterium]MBQ8420498.1 PadR family transcriptional regulator [Clostridia bacterium]